MNSSFSCKHTLAREKYYIFTFRIIRKTHLGIHALFNPVSSHRSFARGTPSAHRQKSTDPDLNIMPATLFHYLFKGHQQALLQEH